ncbi:sulfide/dihydroorotate dehydrogenase-like FAD/NAD-binding protein [Candidatus Woesearchaeota archaeon]|nr:sulfide/dihydroorotate dehydrogenase-like FAD/NAD-binding protein [Candidatus Woesearchaeota archaeon]
MFKIVKKQKLAEDTFLMEIESPEIAKKAKAGQFIILRIDEKGERIPLTIADHSKRTITIVFLVVGETTKQLASLRKGDKLLDFVGPLGNPSDIKEYGTVCLVGGGLGIAPIYSIGKALKKSKNNIITIIGAKTKKHLFWEDRFKKISHKLIICTDDGSKGIKGFVSNALKNLMEEERINLVIAIGPPIMMKVISDITKDRIKTIASLNPIMIDGMGMCGVCRVIVDETVKFACSDGPEFDAHKIEWDELMNRNKMYAEEEQCNNQKCVKK